MTRVTPFNTFKHVRPHLRKRRAIQTDLKGKRVSYVMPLISHVIVPVLSEDGKEVVKYRRIDLLDGSMTERTTCNNDWCQVVDDVTTEEMKWMSSYVEV